MNKEALDFLYETNPTYCLINSINLLTIEEIQYLIQCGVNINQQNSKGETAFMRCMSNGKTDFITFFISYSNANIINNDGLTALFYLFYKEYDYIKNIKHESKLADFSNKTINILQQFINSGFDINHKTKNNHTILDYIYDIECALYSGFKNHTFTLLSYVVNYTKFNFKDSNILFEFTRYFVDNLLANYPLNCKFNLEILMYIINKTEIDINKQNEDNETFLHIIFNDWEKYKLEESCVDIGDLFKIIKGKFNLKLQNNVNETVVDIMQLYGYCIINIKELLY